MRIKRMPANRGGLRDAGWGLSRALLVYTMMYYFFLWIEVSKFCLTNCDFRTVQAGVHSRVICASCSYSETTPPDQSGEVYYQNTRPWVFPGKLTPSKGHPKSITSYLVSCPYICPGVRTRHPGIPEGKHGAILFSLWNNPLIPTYPTKSSVDSTYKIDTYSHCSC